MENDNFLKLVIKEEESRKDILETCERPRKRYFGGGGGDPRTLCGPLK